MTTASRLALRLRHREAAWRAQIEGARRGWRKEVGAKHPLAFGRIYFPEWMPKETPEFHWEIANGFRDYPRFAVAAPVGSAKTTVITKIGNLWSAFCEPVHELLIISSAGALSQMWIEQMGTMLKQNVMLHEDYGDFEGVHWSSEHLELRFKGRTCYIRGIGVGGASRGRRPDRITVDDPEDEASLKTQRIMEEFREWFWTALVNRLDDATKKLTYIGTCISVDAFLVELIQNPRRGWVTKAFAALNEETGESLWESKWPKEYLLMRKEEIGEDAFRQEFQNDPVRAKFGKPFDLSALRIEEREADLEAPVTVCFDPAFKAGGDPWAYTVVRWDEDASWYLMEERKEATGLGEMMEALQDVRRRYRRLIAIGMETSGTQAALEYAVADLGKRTGLYFPMVWLKHGHGKDRSKSSRIIAVSHLVNRGKIVCHPEMDLTIAEMRGWMAGRDKMSQDDHLIDSLAMHMEVGNPRAPKEPVIVTEQDRIRARFRKMTYWRKTPSHPNAIPEWSF